MNKPFNLDYGSALDAAAALRAKAISSVELTQHAFRRIDAFQPELNAYVYQLREQALADAAQADKLLARNETSGVFHGVPISVKESFGVAGQPCTWGMPAHKESRAPSHSTAVRRLLKAGAILLGATNVPQYLMDWQSFNDIYGTSNNPWDLTRTAGGSSGGSAASLAAGMAFLSIGSDIAGSIRVPASFCGIFGHKPTLDIVPRTGHSPGGKQIPVGFSPLLAVAGPMARTAEDLVAALSVLAGPESPEAKALSFSLPSARHKALRDYRIGFVLEEPGVPVSAETKTVLETAIRVCERAGASMREGWPAGFELQPFLDTYLFCLGAYDFSLMTPERQELVRNEMKTWPPALAKGALSSFAEWQTQNLKRLAYRALWNKFFEEVDIFLFPTAFTAAFPHSRTAIHTRMIPLPEGGSQPTWDIVAYLCIASLTGCPATTSPVGLTKSGLPVGLQIAAPYLEDLTSIEFARLLALELGGFQPPPGYSL